MDKIVADQRARGGPRGKPVLFVLVGAMALLAVYMVVMLGWSGSQTPSNPSSTAGQATNSSPANASRVPAENPAYPSPAAPRSGMQGSAPAGSNTGSAPGGTAPGSQPATR